MFLLGDIVTPDGLLPASTVEIDEFGSIVDVSDRHSPRHVEDYSGCLVVPGFIDLHIHGGGGADFMDGTVDAARTVVRTHGAFGTTSLLATTLTASRRDIDRTIDAILSVIRAPGEGEAQILGIHLEGPYICTKRSGAQPYQFIRPPDVDELSHWIEMSYGYIKKITLAPELPGALDFIRWARDRGIIVSIGHTDADSSTVKLAIDAGATHGTHLFNAMSPMGHRAPGTVGALLSSDSVVCELICDGVHVASDVVRVSLRAKGNARIILITDAISGAAMPDGVYQLGGQDVLVENGAATLENGTLAGSVLTMNRAFQNVIDFASVSTVEAAALTSANAAKALSYYSSIGSIEPGKDADIAVINPLDGQIEASMRCGKFLYRRSG